MPFSVNSRIKKSKSAILTPRVTQIEYLCTNNVPKNSIGKIFVIIEVENF